MPCLRGAKMVLVFYQIIQKQIIFSYLVKTEHRSIAQQARHAVPLQVQVQTPFLFFPLRGSGGEQLLLLISWLQKFQIRLRKIIAEQK
jgi:hypothetical protein